MTDNFPDVYTPLRLRPLLESIAFLSVGYAAYTYDLKLGDPALHGIWHILAFFGAMLFVRSLPVPMKKTLRYVYTPPADGVGAAAATQGLLETQCVYTDPWHALEVN